MDDYFKATLREGHATPQSFASVQGPDSAAHLSTSSTDCASLAATTPH